MAKKKAFKKLSESALRKKWADSGLAKDIVVEPEKMLWIPSRFLALNDLMGGGAPYGKIIEIFGEESSGKSLAAFDFGYSTQQLGGIVLWADSEFAFTRQWALANGLDLEQVELFQNKAIEEISDWVVDMGTFYRSQLVNNEPILFVLDSVAACDTLDNLNSPQVDRKAEMGNRAKAMDTFLRSRNNIFEKLGITVILINQLRKKIGASQFEDPDTTPGGAAAKFYASIRLGFYGGKSLTGKINGKDERLGRVTSIRVKKNKIAPPKPTIKGAKVYFHPDYTDGVGFDKYFALPDILERRDVLKRKKGSSRYFIKGKEKSLAAGEESLLKLIREDGKIRRKLIKESGINTISTTRAQIEAIQENLYPIKFGKDEEE